jgi:Holliday junction resolvase RusA-like endonuclease
LNGLYVRPARKPPDYTRLPRKRAVARPEPNLPPPPASFSFFITPPPSTNAIYANRRFGKGRGRVKTKAYKTWIATAGWEIREQHAGALPYYAGEFELEIWLPGTRQDIDNTKAIPDLLKTMHLIRDDKYMISQKVLRYTGERAWVGITLPATRL